MLGDLPMTVYVQTLAAFVLIASTGCQNKFAPPTQTSGSVSHLQMKSGKLTFQCPGNNFLFTLHLGEELIHDTGGVTEVSPRMRWAMRDPTSSYYEATDPTGATGYACAESLYSRDLAGFVENTDIQYQADTGRILITEDKSDGRPCRRYILYTPGRLGGYKVSYLLPVQKVIREGSLPVHPPDIHLLPNDRAEILGKTIKVDDITQNPHPFSVGG